MYDKFEFEFICLLVFEMTDPVQNDLQAIYVFQVGIQMSNQ